MGRILITAFEPFGGSTVNTSAAVCKLLPDEIAGCRVEKVLLPVAFGKAAEIVLHYSADWIGMLGEAGGRTAVTPELTARNRRDAVIPDNAGCQPKQEKIRPDGPDEYHTEVPAERIVRQMREEGYNIALSDNAGAYVCNDTFYLVGTGAQAPTEFIHVPKEPDRAGEYADTVRRFIELAVLSRQGDSSRDRE